MYTGVVYPKPTIEKPRNGPPTDRETYIIACAGLRQKTKKISSRPYF